MSPKTDATSQMTSQDSQQQQSSATPERQPSPTVREDTVNSMPVSTPQCQPPSPIVREDPLNSVPLSTAECEPPSLMVKEDSLKPKSVPSSTTDVSPIVVQPVANDVADFSSLEHSEAFNVSDNDDQTPFQSEIKADQSRTEEQRTPSQVTVTEEQQVNFYGSPMAIAIPPSATSTVSCASPVSVGSPDSVCTTVSFASTASVGSPPFVPNQAIASRRSNRIRERVTKTGLNRMASLDK